MPELYPEIPLVMNVPEAAAILGCGERAVRNLIATERLKHVRLGRLIRIPRHSLLAFLGNDKAKTR